MATSIYFWERNGIVHHSLNSICLSTLYSQDFPTVIELCAMTIFPRKETILQIQANNCLVYLPKPITGNFACLKNTYKEFFLPKGVSQINVSPNCGTLLHKHVAISNLSHKPATDLQHYQWEPNQVALPYTSHCQIADAIQMLTQIETQQSYLADVHSHFIFHQCSSKWPWIFDSFAIILISTIAAVGYGFTICFCFPSRIGSCPKFTSSFPKMASPASSPAPSSRNSTSLTQHNLPPPTPMKLSLYISTQNIQI
jgi:hypothetical protein